ncbi:hypothetical protein Sjap_015791 [Stephania japonica]|uniref:Uncharacterized protein n=1 Tax=Stephania japonica TaxID=461633 RepID=A0AAP0NSV5_9MAGN
MESNEADLTRIDLLHISGGLENVKKAAKSCYGVNFEINVHNFATLRCAAEYLGMTDRFYKSNLNSHTDDFLSRVALLTFSGALVVLKCYVDLLPLAEDLNIVHRCMDLVSTKAYSAANFPSRSLTNWLTKELSILDDYQIQATIFEKDINQFESRIQTKVAYRISNAFVKKIEPRYRIVPSPHQWSISRSTLIRQVSDSETFPLLEEAKFVTLEEIDDYLYTDESIGICIATCPSSTIDLVDDSGRAQALRPWARVEVELTDEYGALKVMAYGSIAEDVISLSAKEIMTKTRAFKARDLQSDKLINKAIDARSYSFRINIHFINIHLIRVNQRLISGDEPLVARSGSLRPVVPTLINDSDLD